MRARLARMEGSARILTLVKLANVGLTMLWGFALTYVFVRILPEGDFRAFLLLVAFNNFSLSAEFGLTNIIYARLRRFWLADGKNHDFRREEIGALFVALCILVLGSTVIAAILIYTGIWYTSAPALFLIFFLASALNVIILLMKRGMAAVDRNLMWESIDLCRRTIALSLLAAALMGLDPAIAMGGLLTATTLSIIIAMRALHIRVAMRREQWTAWRVGGGHIRRVYLRDIGASVALTLSEIIAYNAPYFTIAALTGEARLLLLFDFVFKMSRAVSTAIRATIEAMLPRLTKSWFEGDRAAFKFGLLRAGMVALGVSLCASLLLVAVGQRIFAHLFAGKAVLAMPELWLLCVVLVALGAICVSVYVQGALGRFGPLLARSVPFLGGSLLVMPVAVMLSGNIGANFMALYALVFVGVAGLHVLSLRQLVRAP